MNWHLSHRFDPAVVPLADRHYNRQHVGSPQFAPPGRCLVLSIPMCAFWITSWPFAEYVRHAWPGAWVCSAFRNERRDLYLSSDLITEAVAATCAVWTPPEIGIVSFIDPNKTKHKRDPGRCYIKAGWHYPPCAFCAVDEQAKGKGCDLCLRTGYAHTKGGLRVVQQFPDAMPPAQKAKLLPTPIEAWLTRTA